MEEKVKDESENKEVGENVENAENLDNVEALPVNDLAEKIQAGDNAADKLKIQNLDFILDIPLQVTVELGRKKVFIKDLIQYGQGAVIELDKLAGESLEVLANGKMIAKGEVVVVNEKFGIRLTDIISPLERIETLK